MRALHAHINKQLYRIATISLALLIISIGVNVWFALQPKGAADTCSSLGSYSDILDSFHAGNSRLDGNRDGIP